MKRKSKDRQICIRVDAATLAEVERLRAAISSATNLSVSVSDVFRLGLVELGKKYPKEER